MSSDAKVRLTNDDAQISKLSCVRLGYFRDDFVHLFVRRPTRRSPLINRGYYSRYAVLRSLLLDFISKTANHPSGCQILSLGAGYDTTFFQLTAENALPDTVKYIEVDFIQVVDQKTAVITSQPTLLQCIQPPNTTGDSNATTTLTEQQSTTTEVQQQNQQQQHLPQGILSPTYSLVAADLRSIPAVEAALKTAHWNPTTPTFILTECVLVYMEPQHATNLLEWLASQLHTAAIVMYDPINPNDAFGQQMMINLQSRGSPLLGIVSSQEAQIQRLLTCGWQRAQCKSMAEIYRECIDPVDRKRIERLEIFDEFEEWDLIQQHYCVALGVLDSSNGGDGGGLLSEYRMPTYDTAVGSGVPFPLPPKFIG